MPRRRPACTLAPEEENPGAAVTASTARRRRPRSDCLPGSRPLSPLASRTLLGVEAGPHAEHDRPSGRPSTIEQGSIVFEEQVVQDEEIWHDDDSGDHDGWFCVRTDPFPCPADGCTYVASS